MGEGSSHSSPAPAWGPSHRRQFSTNFSNMRSFPHATVLHELLQCGSPPSGTVLQEQTAPAWVPHGVTSPASKPALVWAPLSTGPQVLPVNLLQHGLLSPQGHGSCQEPAPVWASHGVTVSFRCIHLLQRGVLPGLQVDICSTVDLRGLQRHSLPHRGLLHGLQGKLCSSAWSASSPCFVTDLGVCRVVSFI